MQLGFVIGKEVSVYFFQDDRLVLKNQLICSPVKIISPAFGIISSPVILDIGLRPHGLFPTHTLYKLSGLFLGICVYIHICMWSQLVNRKMPWIWKRARKVSWEGLEGGEEGENWCDYILTSKIKEQKEGCKMCSCSWPASCSLRLKTALFKTVSTALGNLLSVT